MADINCCVSCSTVCLLLFAVSSVLGQFSGPDLNLPTVTDCAVGCPPHWSSMIETYASSISTILNNQQSPLCDYIRVNNLVSSCSYNQTNTACDFRQDSLFCCCPMGNQARIVNGCLRDIAFENVCVPMDVSNWGMGLFNAFTSSQLG